MKRIILSVIMTILAFQCFAQEQVYKATIFGAKSDGITDNTATIQKAIDFISEKGGGTLVFYVGRYLTGAIQLKPGVTLKLEEAAVLVGSTNVYSYKGAPALVWADEEGCTVTGKGVIEGRSAALSAFIEAQKAKGYLPADFKAPELVKGVTVGEEIKLVKDIVANHK